METSSEDTILLLQLREILNNYFVPTLPKIVMYLKEFERPTVESIKQTDKGFDVIVTERSGCNNVFENGASRPSIEWFVDKRPLYQSGQISFYKLPCTQNEELPSLGDIGLRPPDEKSNIGNTFPILNIKEYVQATAVKICNIGEKLHPLSTKPAETNECWSNSLSDKDVSLHKGKPFHGPSDRISETDDVKPPNCTKNNAFTPSDSVKLPYDSGYEIIIETDKTFRVRYFIPKRFVNEKIEYAKTSDDSFEITPGHKSTKKREYFIEIILKDKVELGAKEISKECLERSKDGRSISKVSLPVLVFSSKNDYLFEILLRGIIGPSNNTRTIKYIQFGNLVFEIDCFDFYIGKVRAIVASNDPHICYTEQWLWMNDTLPVEPPGNDCFSYREICDSITDQQFDLLFELFGKAISGQFNNTVKDGVPFHRLILALTISETIRNHYVIGDNETLYEARDHIQDIRSFLRDWHPMIAIGTFKGRNTGFDGKTKAYNKRKPNFYEALQRLQQIS